MEKKEAMKILKEFYDKSATFSIRKALDVVIPELKEFEDEKIRKGLIENFKWFCGDFPETTKWGKDDDLLVKDIIAWLEKQGDKDKLIKELGEYKVKYTQEVLEKHINSMSNKDDERLRKTTIAFLKEFSDKGYENAVECIDWLERQGEQEVIKVYRVENEVEERGLWRKFDGTWQPLFDMLTDGKCKDIPMEDNPIYNNGGKRWFASAPSKKALQEWFSKRDLEELISKGFTITEFEVTEYKKVSDFEYIFTRDSIINKCYLGISDIYPEHNSAWSEEDETEFNHVIKTLKSVEEEQETKGYNNLISSVNWLKSLKDRIQPKQEWSEEERARIDKIVDVLDWAEEKGRISYSDWEDYVTYVKSLKPQNKQNTTWSEEDETALADALWCCKQAASIAKNKNDMGNVWFAEWWLKSLKCKVQSQVKQADAFIEKACNYLNENCRRFVLTEKDINDFKKYMKEE